MIMILLEEGSPLDVFSVCHVQHNQLQSNIHDFDDKPHKYWSVVEYDRIVQTFAEDPVEELDIEEEVVADNLFTQQNQNLEEPSDSSDSEVDTDGEGDTDGSDSDRTVLNPQGLNSQCPLNVLDSFHCVQGHTDAITLF